MEPHAKRPRAAPPSETPTVEYNGYVPPSGSSFVSPADIDRVALKDWSAERLYDRFIASRRPCVLTGLPDSTDRFWRLGDLDYLREKSGDASVKVEWRRSTTETFGRGQETHLRFRGFLDRVAGGDDSLYMTTQTLEEDFEGRPHLWGSPLTELGDDVPLRPHWMGHLIPANINLWLGHSTDGSMSGLHHDFHDNCYILLRGKKRFELFPPSAAPLLETVGSVEHIYPNGRIVYSGEKVRADGADCGASTELRASDAQKEAERALEEAERAVERGEEGAQARLEAAEEALFDAMDQALEDEVGDDHSDEDEEEEEEEDSEEGGDSAGAEAATTRTASTPKSFSRLNLSVESDRERLRRLGPRLPCAVCEVREREALFLPAGWFHNVTSFSRDDAGAAGSFHCALNYWFHPPDAGEGRFVQPYRDNFWQWEWQQRGLPALSQESCPTIAACAKKTTA